MSCIYCKGRCHTELYRGVTLGTVTIGMKGFYSIYTLLENCDEFVNISMIQLLTQNY